MTPKPVALITGASRGLGRGIAMELSRAGYDLVINYATNQEAAIATAQECRACADESHQPIRILLSGADVGVAADRERLIAETRNYFGRLHLLVNNAGIASPGRKDILEATEESFDRVMAVNLKGPYFLTQLAARWMIEQSQEEAKSREENQPVLPTSKRRIITISSLSAYTASVNRGDYCVSKAGLGMLTQLYAARLAEHGINVYEIRPGIMETDMTAPVRAKYDQLLAQGLTPIARWGMPEEVGRAVAAIARDLFPFSTGEVFNVDGGFHLRRL